MFFLLVSQLNSSQLFCQTTFTEDASGKGLNLDGTKDGGFTFSDFNNDGYIDLMVNTSRNAATHRSRLYYNDGPPNFTFTDVTTTKAKGLIASGLSGGDIMERSAVSGDLNNDGYVDFIRNTYTRFELYLNNGSAAGYTFGTGVDQDPNFVLWSPSSGDSNPPNGITNGMNIEGMGLLDYDNDGDLDIMFENHNFGIDIYRNNIIPSGTFSLTHVTPGTATILGLDQTAVDGDYSSVTDFDDDGYVDIVARKRNMEDFWRNNGDSTFTAVSWVDEQASNSDKGAVSLYDFDNDGDFDLVWTNNDVNQIWQQSGVGSGVFVGTNEPAVSSGVTLPTAGIDGLACGDIDNDGDVDLFFSDDTGESFLFINETPVGDTTLTFTRNNCGIDVDEDGEGAAFIDFDNDGDLDLYININNDDNQLWINNLPNGLRKRHLYVRVLENIDSTIAERDALGATVVLRDCNGDVLSGIREVNGGNGHGTQDPAFVHFGLPNGDNKEYIVEIRYPYLNGQREISSHRVVPSALGDYHLLEINPQFVLDNPIAVDDNGESIFTGSIDTFNVLTNDYDIEFDEFSIFSILDPPNLGTAVITASDTSIQYTAGLIPGTDTIVYQICQSDCPALCDEAFLIINIVLESDYGDAPASYQDICFNIIPNGSQPNSPTRLGATVDGDLSMQNSADSDGDDLDGNNDDDGVTFVGGTIIDKGTTETVSFSWTTNDVEGHIFGWIDFNDNGVFDDPSERIINNFLVGSGTANGSSGLASVNYTVPLAAQCGQTYARFTIQDELSEVGPDGNFCLINTTSHDGEVEDYAIEITGCVENCANGIDDDGDGLVDCFDCEDCFDSGDCDDNDNDGINDICDIDDDNDGIPDVEECYSNIAISNPDGIQDGNYPIGFWDAEYFRGYYGIAGSTGWTNDGDGSNSPGSPVYLGESFLGFNATTFNESKAFATNQSPTSVAVAPANYVGTNWDPTDNNPFYQIQFNRQMDVSGNITFNGFFDDVVEVFVNGTRVLFIGQCCGGLPTGNYSVSFSSGDNLQIRYTNLGYIGSFNFTLSMTFLCNRDTDLDGITNDLDLDSDNDGIFDLDEAGHSEADLNLDGIIDGPNADFGTNGLFDDLETSPDNNILNYTISDSESTPDGTYDPYELDADGDSCYDAFEENIPDSENDGIAGTNPTSVNGDGLVIGSSYGRPTRNFWQNFNIVPCLPEDCDDLVDNDGDGDIDCDDSDCITSPSISTSLTTACINQTITISSSDIGSGTTYNWDFGTAATPATASGIGAHNVYYSSCGAKTISLTVERNGCSITIDSIINIVDTSNPVWDTDPQDLIMECISSANYPDSIANWLSIYGNGSASDNCGHFVITNDYSSLSADCGATASTSVTFTATDSCGNSASRSANIRIIDTNAPLIDPVGDVTVDCEMVPAAATPSIEDDCDTTPDLVYLDVLVQHPSASWKSDPGCAILYEVTSGSYDDKGTPATGDDEMSFILTVVGRNASAGWSTTIAGNPYSAPYFSSLSIGPFLSNGPSISFTLTDDSNPSCQQVISINGNDF